MQQTNSMAQQVTSIADIDHNKLCQDVYEHVMAKLVRGSRISYRDPEYPGEIIREYGDGRRVVLHVTLPDDDATEATITEGREIPPFDYMCPTRIAEEIAQYHWACYRDPEYPGVLIREYPDGHRIILHVPADKDGDITEGREIPPRKDHTCPPPLAAPA